ncbi:Uncharacterized protein dnm_099500 [Desulfonema magnum]|uniref:Uncharacterized protein n=1 Tax=Desulfonema magnum TaxID=45655 RepID=A0A975BYJ1_9BACT|nr:Uncharacterized protein dnm_099500 [Desulfonema magnum]
MKVRTESYQLSLKVYNFLYKNKKFRNWKSGLMKNRLVLTDWL